MRCSGLRRLCIVVALFVLMQSTGAIGRPREAAPHESSHTKLILLGTGTPNADPQRWGPAVAIIVDSAVYLVDAGVGIVRRAVAAGLLPKQLQRVFITHLHSDHTLGLPDLMLSPWVLERPVPLEVYGPPGIDSMVRNIESAWHEDINIRLHGGEPQHPGSVRAIVHDITAGKIYEDNNIRVDAIPVAHGTWHHAYGFRFTTPDGTIVISGDTRPTDSLVDACQSCDILVHEVYSAEKFKTRPQEWQQYHRAYHTSTTELGHMALRAQPKTLVLYHQLFWGSTDDDLLREIREAGYSGTVVSGKDLDVFEGGK